MNFVKSLRIFCKTSLNGCFCNTAKSIKQTLFSCSYLQSPRTELCIICIMKLPELVPTVLHFVSWYFLFCSSFFPYNHRSLSIVLQPSPFFLIHTLSSYLLLTTIVWTRSQLKNLSKDQLIHKVPSLESFKDDIILKLQSWMIISTILKPNMKWWTVTCWF